MNIYKIFALMLIIVSVAVVIQGLMKCGDQDDTIEIFGVIYGGAFKQFKRLTPPLEKGSQGDVFLYAYSKATQPLGEHLERIFKIFKDHQQKIKIIEKINKFAGKPFNCLTRILDKKLSDSYFKKLMEQTKQLDALCNNPEMLKKIVALEKLKEKADPKSALQDLELYINPLKKITKKIQQICTLWVKQ